MYSRLRLLCFFITWWSVSPICEYVLIHLCLSVVGLVDDLCWVMDYKIAHFCTSVMFVTVLKVSPENFYQCIGVLMFAMSHVAHQDISISQTTYPVCSHRYCHWLMAQITGRMFWCSADHLGWQSKSMQWVGKHPLHVYVSFSSYLQLQ